MTHGELVNLACRWLEKSERCVVVVGEMASACAETPDALGIVTGRSVLVECKTSRSDFLADAKKPVSDLPRQGDGRHALLNLAPAGIIQPDELPLGWGLLEPTERGGIRVVRRSHAADCYCGDRVGWRRVVHCAPPFRAGKGERDLLVSLIRRLGGVGVRGNARVRISGYYMDEKGKRVEVPA